MNNVAVLSTGAYALLAVLALFFVGFALYLVRGQRSRERIHEEWVDKLSVVDEIDHHIAHCLDSATYPPQTVDLSYLKNKAKLLEDVRRLISEEYSLLTEPVSGATSSEREALLRMLHDVKERSILADADLEKRLADARS